MYNAAGIDVSKGRSTVTVLQPGGAVIHKPFDVPHTPKNPSQLSEYLCPLDGGTRIVMGCTGRYHEPVANALHKAGLSVSVANPHLIKNFGSSSLRKVKPDPADARKTARHAPDNRAGLRQYVDMDNTRAQLKTLNSQFSFFMKQKAAVKASPIALPDNTCPGVNRPFDSPARDDGSGKWVDYAYSFRHVDCVRKTGLKTFTEHYKAFCKKHHYNFQAPKPEGLFHASKEPAAVFPKGKNHRLLIRQSIKQLNPASGHAGQLRKEMDAPASSLPEYTTVMNIYGVGKTHGPQPMAGTGDVSGFTHREALTAFAGVDPGADESGQRISKSSRASKTGSGRLRKTLFQIMPTLLQNAPADDPVYRFPDKKRSGGKPYYVCMTAGANKFLRIYYGKVKECPASLPQ